jgi:putative oxidoreductase
MRTVSTIARYLAGVIFLVFGLNGFLNFIPLPPPGGVAGQFMGALYTSHYLWVIFAFQIIPPWPAHSDEARMDRPVA